jgi:hypothetical protein
MDSRHACMQLTKSQHPPPKNQAQGCGVCLCLWRCPAPPGEDAVGDQGWALCHPMVPSCIASHPTGPIKHSKHSLLWPRNMKTPSCLHIRHSAYTKLGLSLLSTQREAHRSTPTCGWSSSPKERYLSIYCEIPASTNPATDTPSPRCPSNK